MTLSDCDERTAGTALGGSIAECAKELGISKKAMEARARRFREHEKMGLSAKFKLLN